MVRPLIYSVSLAFKYRGYTAVVLVLSTGECYEGNYDWSSYWVFQDVVKSFLEVILDDFVQWCLNRNSVKVTNSTSQLTISCIKKVLM